MARYLSLIPLGLFHGPKILRVGIRNHFRCRVSVFLFPFPFESKEAFDVPENKKTAP
jgi:hypothetical protein